MIRKLFRATFWIFIGMLVAQVPTGNTTAGQVAWRHTRQLLDWSGAKADTLVSQAGLGSGVLLRKWEEWFTTRQKGPADSAAMDDEGLSDSDKEALRLLLE